MPNSDLSPSVATSSVDASESARPGIVQPPGAFRGSSLFENCWLIEQSIRNCHQAIQSSREAIRAEATAEMPIFFETYLLLEQAAQSFLETMQNPAKRSRSSLRP